MLHYYTMLHYNTMFGSCSFDGRSGLHSLPAAVPETDVPETSQWRQGHELPVLLLSAGPLTALSPFLRLPSFRLSFLLAWTAACPSATFGKKEEAWRQKESAIDRSFVASFDTFFSGPVSGFRPAVCVCVCVLGVCVGVNR